MWISSDCFRDEELRLEMDKAARDGRCEVCGKDTKVADISVVSDFLKSLLELFQIDGNSSTDVVDLIQHDWSLFENDACAGVILEEIIQQGYFSFSLEDKVSYIPDIIERISVWDNLKREVRENYRFFIDHDKFDEYADLSPSFLLKAGSVLYRARLVPEGQKKIRRKEMGCPPKEKSIAGRANPIGIPYLYLCKDEKTTYFEVRANYLDKLSIGKFRIKRDLQIVDFNSNISLFLAYSLGCSLVDTVVKKKISDFISSDLSKPLRRYDTEIEYVPTQLICEYCKRNGADGVCFDSSLHAGGMNYVLFNPNDAACISVLNREIKSVDINV